MAVSVAFSTLMVLLSGSGQDLITLWNSGGGVNDPAGNKHELDLPTVLRGGSFRSVVVDNWAMEAYDCVSVYGTNVFGDIFWETEFNVTGLASLLDDWLLGNYIIRSSADTVATQTAIYDAQNYRLRLSSSTGTSWFAVSNISLSYGPLPVIFVPRSTSTPFGDPAFVDGHLGCWPFAEVINVVFKYSDSSSMSPASCIDTCKDTATIAMLANGQECRCADKDPDVEPTNNDINCYLPCPGSSSDYCGGFGTTDGNAYHVQGSHLPGHVNTVQLYQTTLYNVNTTIQIDILDIFATSTTPAFITEVVVNVTGPPVPTCTLWYNESDCIEAGGNMQSLSFDGTGPTVFLADGSVAKVDILRVRCTELILSETVSEVAVELWGPDVSSDHVEVPALVIRGKHITPVTTTSSTTTTTTSTSTTSTTTPTTNATTTPPSTTTTTSSPSSNATTSPSTPTSTASPSSTTTSPSSTSTTSVSTSITTPSPSNATSSVSSSSTTTTLESSTSTTTSLETTKATVCFCPCNVTVPQLNLTTAELEEKVVEIQRRLALNVSKLSSTIRKLTSAEDSRVSAVSIGYLGVGIMVSIFASIVFIDSAVLFRDIKKLFTNIKNGLCPPDGDSQS